MTYEQLAVFVLVGFVVLPALLTLVDRVMGR